VPNILLPLPNKRQQQTADCLAACAFMVLSHLGMIIAYEELLKLLKVKSFGAAGQNLKYLSSLGVNVVYREGSLSELKQHLEAGFPCVVLVRTAELSYWSYSTDHAVVVVGFDDDYIFVNDPAFDLAPVAVPVTEFELAWMFFDYRYGLIQTVEAKGN
jgi:ABC-type bacteriocin/lantibiotic exporter with double-glycine peptidase domain